MSHQILSLDFQQGREIAWHKLTEVVSNLCLSLSRFAQWDYKAIPLSTEYGPAVPVEDTNPFHVLTVTDRPGVLVGKPFNPNTFAVFQNGQLLEVLNEVEAAGAKLESCGTIDNRARRFFSFKVNGDFKAAGREFKPYLTAVDSIDGSTRLRFFVSFTCIVCANTFRMALQELEQDKGGSIAAVKHTKNAHKRLLEVPNLIRAFYAGTEAFAKRVDSFAEVMVKTAEAKAFFAAYLAGAFKVQDATPAKGQLLGTRSLNQVDRLTELFSRGAGNRGETGADLFSAATDFYSHEHSGRVDGTQSAAEQTRLRWKQFQSSEFGAGAGAKEEFAALLERSLSNDTLPLIYKRGEEVLVESLKAQATARN